MERSLRITGKNVDGSLQGVCAACNRHFSSERESPDDPMRQLARAFNEHVCFTIVCSECSQPIALESTKVDRFGKPIHDECYLARVRRERESNLPE